MNTKEWVLCGTLIFISTAMLMAPVLRYVIVGWRAKRKDIMDGLNADARLAYFEMFSRSSAPSKANCAQDDFEKLYHEGYGRRLFLVPGLLLLIVGLIAITFVVLTVLHTQGNTPNPLFDVKETGIAAIAGAYMWVVNDFISRARRLDFAPSDISWGALRLIVSVPMGYAFAAVAAESVGPFVAFAVGAFPLSELTSMLRRLTNKSLKLEDTADEASDNIVKLQGVNATIVERLKNEDITTVTQIAYCDPVRLTMRSNLTFNYVTDCMNSALAWLYLEDDLEKLRPLGMRGAVEIKYLLDDFLSTDPARQADHERAVSAFPKLAAAIGQGPDTLQLVFCQIAEDPFTVFLHRIWD